MTETSVAEDTDLSTVVSLLDDEHARSILVETSEEPLSAAELSERCDVSVSSIYRRLDRLEAANLLDEQTRPRRDGHHDTVYASLLGRFELTIQDGSVEWTVEETDTDVADELTRLWGNF
ncbi:ArsR/SmtB family transcription factor [Halomicroarcula sp. GCM10025709]|uniref:ArsR/SmtB family transcription factor n=1 Tax=Haloarcula TaxID=2237 RepID=UPI0024C33D2E|nr:winged helix-turn-helix domain-containing protein [Halomicroarcula sp. YJ-61-S]